ncbi:MAG: PLD nuclease N-terminal domain-containing protein [Candidatus Nanopelagicales bacterium]|nr:PLD nuclease N-terminal domain-containing protein [Candidatus Nanopelagicales bacterium]
MIRVAGIIVLLAVYIWCMVDVLRSPRSTVRNLPKGIWLMIVVLVPIIGGAFWIAFGRTSQTRTRRARRGPVAPDDDPRFLAKLDEEEWRRRMRERRDEA